MLALASIFSSGMVLQRDKPLPVWGRADAGAYVRVALHYSNGANKPPLKQELSATADAQGNWSVRLEPLSSDVNDGRPLELTISSGAENILLSDILVGEVWVCSGQSNMEWPLHGALNPKEEIAAANFPKIRLFTVPRISKDEPQETCGGKWLPCSPEHAKDFSAVGYFFGRHLQESLNVPLGLINSSYGGTQAEAWTSREALERVETYHAVFAQHRRDQEVAQRLLTEKKELLRFDLGYPVYKDTGNEGVAKGWASSDFDAAGWPSVAMPNYWERTEIGDWDGVVWFRKEIDVPQAWAGKELKLELGPLDDFDHTYFNGEQIGGIGPENPNAFATPRHYKVPGKLVKAGRNLIAVRIFDHFGNGGFAGQPGDLSLQREGGSVGQIISLAGNWQWKFERKLEPLRLPGNIGPSGLYNAMLHPIIPYALRGAIWYQGESNADRAKAYRKLLPLMILDWRSKWKHGGQGDFAFLIVSLANFENPVTHPGESDWAELREAQTWTAKSVPNTGLALALDLGEANDIHPRNKQEVGRRLGLVAEAQVYAQTKVIASGPFFESCKIEGANVRLKFKSAHGGLKTKDGGDPRGFSIAGADKKFYWAHAKVAGQNEIVLSAKEVPQPLAARYAWAKNPFDGPHGCNVYNAFGLPLDSFRTDAWPGVTK